MENNANFNINLNKEMFEFFSVNYKYFHIPFQ